MSSSPPSNFESQMESSASDGFSQQFAAKAAAHGVEIDDPTVHKRIPSSSGTSHSTVGHGVSTNSGAGQGASTDGDGHGASTNSGLLWGLLGAGIGTLLIAAVVGGFIIYHRKHQSKALDQDQESPRSMVAMQVAEAPGDDNGDCVTVVNNPLAQTDADITTEVLQAALRAGVNLTDEQELAQFTVAYCTSTGVGSDAAPGTLQEENKATGTLVI